ncbi:MAG: patatin-like phospholipase family protein, partial [Candidatus Krumholzibacteriia bacterium]
MPPPTKLALCLSGGGFRAALFHLGLLRRLHELGTLGQVSTISSVSGGSILAGLLCEQMRRYDLASLAEVGDWEAQIAVPLRRVVSRDLRTLPILATCLFNWVLPGPRAQAMLRRYRDRVSRLALVDIPATPRFVFCASDLVFGANWT